MQVILQLIYDFTILEMLSTCTDYFTENFFPSMMKMPPLV